MSQNKEPKFKVGDKVKATYNTNPLKKGDEATIIGFNKSWDNRLKLERPDQNLKAYSFCPSHFELATSELDALLEVVNKGSDAMNQLWSYKNEIDFIPNGGFNGQQTYKFSRKVKPSVEPPKLTEGWVVSLVAGEPLRVQVGCKKFIAGNLSEALNAMLQNNNSGYTHGAEFKLVASRNGLLYQDHVLSWASAELLQKYLQEVLK